MGRGQQMSSWDMERSVVDTSGKDFRNKRRTALLVTFSAFLLPFLITSSYIYYNSTSNASTEASMMFFQRRPFSSLIPPKEDADASSFDSGIQLGGEIDDTENTESTELGNTEADAVTEDVVTEAVAPSEPAISVNETSSVLGFPEHEQASVTTAAVNSTSPDVNSLSPGVNATMVESGASDSLGAMPVEGNARADEVAVNSTSLDVNASTVESDAWKQSNVPDEKPKHHQQSEPSVLAMESQNKGVCDLVKGSWVPDSRPPQYTNVTCPYIQGHQDCIKNGRPDVGYLHWKWQPEQCELPRLDAAAFLSAMRDRSMYFVGDSLARNQFQSLLCLLSQAEMPDHTYQQADDKDNVYVFRSHNFTLAIYWSTHLVHVENHVITWPDNSTVDVAYIHVDELDRAWVERAPGVDVLQISTGQWWFKKALFLVGGRPIGCHWWDDDGHTSDDWKECTKVIGFGDPYRMAVHNALQGSVSIPGYTGTTVLRTFAPDHFEDGQWHNGGKCVRTSPGGVPMKDITRWMYEIQIQEFQNVTGALSASEKKRLKLLDITNLAQVRADGHPDAYRNFQPFSKESKQPVQKDCLHWCLPGPIDTWNELLAETLHL